MEAGARGCDEIVRKNDSTKPRSAQSLRGFSFWGGSFGAGARAMNAVSDVQFRDRLKRNINRTLAFGFFQVFLVIMPVVVPFFESRGLTMQQIFLLQGLFAVVVLVMEIPSGYVADLLGRRLTLITGSVFIGLGHAMLL